LQGLLRYSGSSGAMIGFDCVPITSAETIGGGMGGAFPLMLTAIAHGDRIAAISEAAGTEYRGERTMLAAADIAGPETAAITLPVDANEPTPAALAEARELLLDGELP